MVKMTFGNKINKKGEQRPIFNHFLDLFFLFKPRYSSVFSFCVPFFFFLTLDSYDYIDTVSLLTLLLLLLRDLVALDFFFETAEERALTFPPCSAAFPVFFRLLTLGLPYDSISMV